MKYMCLLRPHANSRYQAGVTTLAASEIRLLLAHAGVEAEPVKEIRAGVEWLRFECGELDARGVREIERCAHIHLLMEEHEGGLLLPIASAQEPYVGADLPYVLKYKGKTNETFTGFLINLALASSEFSGDDQLRLLDPMCGRGTTLFEALNRGWHAAGTDVLAADVDEAGKFFKRYLEYHRMKHSVSKKSMTARGKEAAVLQTFEFGRNSLEFKAGNTRTLSLTVADAGRIAAVWPKRSFHLLAADLPYGVQHAPGGQKGKTLQQMVKDVLPAWREALMPGGAMALSFNVNTLKRDFIREAMAEAGLQVMEGGAYDGLEHWVEQAIARDVAVAVRV